MSAEPQNNAQSSSSAPPLAPQGDSISKTLSDLGPAGVIAAMSSVLPAIGGAALATYVDTVGKWFRSHGSEGLTMYTLGFVLVSGLAIMPTHVCAFLGGWAFDLQHGFVAALLGFLGGALLAYVIVRPTAATRVERMLAKHQKFKTVRDALVGGSTMKTLGIVTLVRVPLTPFSLINLVLASVRVPLWIYMLGTLIGMVPRTAIAVWLGSQLKHLLASEASKQKPTWFIIGGIVLTLIVFWICGAIANKALAKLTQASPNTK